MADEPIGLVVEAKDKASGVLATIGSKGQKSLSLVREGAAKAGDALKAIGIAGALFNQTLELARKGVEMFRMAVLDTIAASLEFRRETDPAVKAFKEMEKNASLLRARIGDALIPIMMGLNDALKETSAGMLEWINLNRELIATNITTWLAETSRLLIEGVAKGVELVTKAWTGWLQIWNTIKAVTEEYFAVVLSGVEKALSHIGWLASAFDSDLAIGINEAAAAAKDLGEEFDRSGDRSLAKVAELAEAQKKRERALRDFKINAIDFVGNAELAILERIKTSTQGLTTTIEERKKAYKDLDRALEELHQRNKARKEEEKRMEDELLKKVRDTKAKMEAAARRYEQLLLSVGNSLGTMWGRVFAEMLTNSKNALKGMVMAIIDSVQIGVNAYAILAAAAAAASESATPIIGPVLAIIAANTMLAFVKGLLANLPEAQFGGRIGGGTPGVDSVPVLTQAGEGVLTVKQMKLFDRMVGSLDKLSASGQLAAPAAVAAGAGGGVVVQQHNNFNSVTAPTSAETSRSMRQVNKQLKRLHRRGF
jgi:hypothetical protein